MDEGPKSICYAVLENNEDYLRQKLAITDLSGKGNKHQEHFPSKEATSIGSSPAKLPIHVNSSHTGTSSQHMKGNNELNKAG